MEIAPSSISTPLPVDDATDALFCSSPSPLLLGFEIGAAASAGELCGRDLFQLGLLALVLAGELGELADALFCSACWFNALIRSFTPMTATPTTI